MNAVYNEFLNRNAQILSFDLENVQKSLGIFWESIDPELFNPFMVYYWNRPVFEQLPDFWRLHTSGLDVSGFTYYQLAELAGRVYYRQSDFKSDFFNLSFLTEYDKTVQARIKADSRISPFSRGGMVVFGELIQDASFYHDIESQILTLKNQNFSVMYGKVYGNYLRESTHRYSIFEKVRILKDANSSGNFYDVPDGYNWLAENLENPYSYYYDFLNEAQSRVWVVGRMIYELSVSTGIKAVVDSETRKIYDDLENIKRDNRRALSQSRVELYGQAEAVNSEARQVLNQWESEKLSLQLQLVNLQSSLNARK